MALTAQQQIAIANMNILAQAAGLPTYTKVAVSLCDVLDGEQAHDIAEMCVSNPQEVHEIRETLKPLYLESCN